MALLSSPHQTSLKPGRGWAGPTARCSVKIKTDVAVGKGEANPRGERVGVDAALGES